MILYTPKKASARLCWQEAYCRLLAAPVKEADNAHSRAFSQHPAAITARCSKHTAGHYVRRLCGTNGLSVRT